MSALRGKSALGTFQSSERRVFASAARGVLDPKGEPMGLEGPSIPARVEPLELPEPARDPDREQPTEEPAAPVAPPTEEPVPV